MWNRDSLAPRVEPIVDVVAARRALGLRGMRARSPKLAQFTCYAARVAARVAFAFRARGASSSGDASAREVVALSSARGFADHPLWVAKVQREARGAGPPMHRAARSRALRITHRPQSTVLSGTRARLPDRNFLRRSGGRVLHRAFEPSCAHIRGCGGRRVRRGNEDTAACAGAEACDYVVVVVIVVPTLPGSRLATPRAWPDGSRGRPCAC
eukprot:1000838-Pyramimonas_sp.AAC.1